ncbi:ligand-binding sensor domain-containing protein [Marivirga sp.]|uniref:ligand-binding sensor domain-containing protein n=1 Tax=Marivirga sp. TaxID=2018662 RepID=UPI003DA7A1B6
MSSKALGQFYPAKLYSLRDGMPTNAIYDITQSPDGIMWFMTSKGIVNYNSLNWKLYPDSLKLPNSPYSFIKSLDDGSIWVAGQNSDGFTVRYLKDEQWHSVISKDIEGKFTFDVKMIDNGYMIVIADRNKLNLINTSAGTVQKISLSDKRTYRINAVSFKEESIYVSTKEGLYVYNKSLKQHPVNALLDDKKEILKISFKEDELYLLGRNWLGLYKNSEFKYLNENTGVNEISRFNKHNLTIDQFDRIFFSSMSSARYLDKSSGKSEILYINGRIFNAQSNKIFVDAENNIWVGDHRGLFKFNVLRFQNYNQNIGLADDEVTAISNYQNQLVLANENHLNFLNQGSIEKIITIEHNSDFRILDLANDGKDKLYIAAYSAGLKKYDGQKITNISLPDKGQANYVNSVEYIGEDLFFSTNQALYSYKNEIVRKEADLPYIRNINYLQLDSIAALNTSNGLFLYNPKSKEVKKITSESLNYNNVYNICKWKGQFLIGTSGGLGVIKNNEIVPYSLSDKLNRVAVYGLFVSKNNELWIGTNEGVFIWDGHKLINYNRAHGLIGDEINRNAFLQLNNGKIWIGTELGASVYDFDKDISIDIVPNLKITSAITTEGTSLNEQENILNYDNNTVEFNFIGISYFDENQIKYRYKLEGFDNDYIFTNRLNSNSIRYTNLRPGNYRFLVESSIDNNTWSKPQVIDFTIQKPFYSTYWFLLLITIAVLIILYSIYRIRFYFILENQKKLKKEVELRTEEIQRMNNEIQAKNEELINQSEQIANNNERLEDIVQDRTQKLKEQNERLSKYAFMNSHELRGPICRMTGLLNLLKLTKNEEHHKILLLIQETGLELDAVTRKINETLDNVDLKEFYKANSIEIINAEIREKQGTRKVKD